MSKKVKSATTIAAKKILKKIQKFEKKTNEPCELGVLRHIDDALRGIIAGEKVSINIGTHTTIEYVCDDDDKIDVKSTLNFTDTTEHAEDSQDETDDVGKCYGDVDDRDEGTAE